MRSWALGLDLNPINWPSSLRMKYLCRQFLMCSPEKCFNVDHDPRQSLIPHLFWTATPPWQCCCWSQGTTRNCFDLPSFVISVQFSFTNCILEYYLESVDKLEQLSLVHINVTEVTNSHANHKRIFQMIISWLLTTHHIEAVTLFSLQVVLLLWVSWVSSIIQVGLGHSSKLLRSIDMLQSRSSQRAAEAAVSLWRVCLRFTLQQSPGQCGQSQSGSVSLSRPPLRLCLAWPDDDQLNEWSTTQQQQQLCTDSWRRHERKQNTS